MMHGCGIEGAKTLRSKKSLDSSSDDAAAWLTHIHHFSALIHNAHPALEHSPPLRSDISKIGPIHWGRDRERDPESKPFLGTKEADVPKVTKDVFKLSKIIEHVLGQTICTYSGWNAQLSGPRSGISGAC